MRKSLAFLGMLALALAGCSSGGTTGTPDADDPDGLGSDIVDSDGRGDIPRLEVDNPGDYSVETEVGASSVETGVALPVTCTVTGPDGVVQTWTEITVTPAEGWTLENATLTFSQPGEYQVACRAPDVPATDATPASVQVSAGRPANVETAVAPASVTAGSTATVTCTGKDAQGNNATGDFEVRLIPAEGVAVKAGSAAGTFDAEGRTAGTYSVACALVGTTVVDPSPASLAVTAGALAKVITTLENPTMTAGTTGKGSCKAVDAFGNEVSGIQFQVKSPEDLTVVQSSIGFTVTGKKAGSYELACTPKDDTAATLEKATLKIEAGPAVGIELKLVPQKPVYQVSNQVKVGFDLVDAYGNPVPGGAMTNPTVTPLEGVTQISADQFQFDQEGQFVFHACDATNAALCDDVTGWCDGTAPALTITFPERGATLTGERRVVVTGTVNDTTSQVGSLMINGKSVQIGADGAFQFPMEPGQGLNLIDATATDTFGNPTRTLRSYLFSNQWYPMGQADPLASAVPNALKAYLDDTLFWSADTTDEATISAILEMAVANLDLTTLIPNPVTTVSQSIGLDTCGYQVFLDSVTFDAPDVKIAPVFGALTINIVIPNLKATLRLVKIDGGFLCPGNQGGEATADKVTLNSTVQASVDPTTHLILMSASEAELVMDGFDVKINNWFYDLIVGLLKGTIENLLKDQVKTLLTDQINKLPETLNDALAKPFEVALPELLPGMTPITLRISVQPQTLNFDTAGGALDLNAAVTSDHLIDRQILGSMGHSSCLSTTPDPFGFDMANPEKLMLAVFDDVLNEALYSLWDSRLLNLHLSAETLDMDLAQYGVADLDATTAALIPPVISACNPAGTLTAQVGDLYLEASFVLMGEPVNIHTFLFLEVEMDLALADDPEKGPVIAITIKGPPKVFDMDVVYLDSTLTQDDVTGLIMGLIPVVFEQLKDPITVAIPTFNLKGLLGSGGSVPITLPDKDLVIVPKVLNHTKGYLNVAAGLELREPVAPPAP